MRPVQHDSWLYWVVFGCSVLKKVFCEKMGRSQKHKVRMGKQEGMKTTNVAKRQSQNVWVKDKQQTKYQGFAYCVFSFMFCLWVFFGM